MCKVDGCFVLIPINEVTQMRPDMSNFVQSAYAKDEMFAGDEDEDFKPPIESKPTPAPKDSSSKASSSKAKGAPKTVKVCGHLPVVCCLIVHVCVDRSMHSW